MDISGEIIEGNLTKRINITTHDEIGQLGESFNKMVDSLRLLLRGTIITVQKLADSSSELTACAEETSKASEQIVVMIEQVATGAENQLNRSEECSKSIEMMTNGIRRVAENTLKVS